MGNALSSDSACPMEEDILRFIESDSFKFLIAEEAADEIEELDVRKKRKRNVIQRCTNLWETNWGKMLLNPATADIETWEGKKFRRRFRMDYRMFREVLVPMCKEINELFDYGNNYEKDDDSTVDNNASYFMERISKDVTATHQVTLMFQFVSQRLVHL